jgi:hypothetical protein
MQNPWSKKCWKKHEQIIENGAQKVPEIDENLIKTEAWKLMLKKVPPEPFRSRSPDKG